MDSQDMDHFWRGFLNHSVINNELPMVPRVEIPIGDYCLSSWILYSIVVIDACILVIGLVGNTIACIVIGCSKSMHTPTNCYLFSLSMSDLLLLITGAPHEIYEIYNSDTFYAGPVGCLLRSWAAEISVNVSVITITAFTFERYLAICRPFVAHAMSQISRVKKLIVIIWLVAILIALPVAGQHRYSEINDGIRCEFDERVIPYSLEVTTTVFFIIPLSVITVMYILIGMSLVKSSKIKGNHANVDKNTKRTVKMLVIIVLAFFLCWAPFHIQRLMTGHFNEIQEDIAPAYDTAYCIITHLSGVTYLLSAVINPLVYSIMSSKFREAFEVLLFKTCKDFCRANFNGWGSTLNVTRHTDIPRVSERVV